MSGDYDKQIRAAATAITQDGCANGDHIYMNGWHDELSRCACGKVHPEHLHLAEGQA